MAWNRGSEGVTPVKTKAKPSPVRGIVAGLAVVVLAVGAYFAFFSGVDTKEETKTDKRPGQIKEVKPAAAPKVSTNNAPEQLGKGFRRTRKGGIIKVPKNPFGTPIPKDLEYKPFWEYTDEDCARVDPGYAERHKRFLEQEEKSVFKTGADRVLSVLLFSEPGQPSLLIPFDEGFKKQFLDSIKTPIIVSKDDPPEVQEQKRAMIEAKLYLKDRMDAGEDIVKLLNDEMKQRQKVQGLRNTLEEELANVRANATSVDEIKDYVDAANAMLENEGASKIHFSDKFLKHSVERNKLRLEREQQQSQQ